MEGNVKVNFSIADKVIILNKFEHCPISDRLTTNMKK